MNAAVAPGLYVYRYNGIPAFVWYGHEGARTVLRAPMDGSGPCHVLTRSALPECLGVPVLEFTEPYDFPLRPGSPVETIADLLEEYLRFRPTDLELAALSIFAVNSDSIEPVLNGRTRQERSRTLAARTLPVMGDVVRSSEAYVAADRAVNALLSRAQGSDRVAEASFEEEVRFTYGEYPVSSVATLSYAVGDGRDGFAVLEGCAGYARDGVERSFGVTAETTRRRDMQEPCGDIVGARFNLMRAALAASAFSAFPNSVATDVYRAVEGSIDINRSWHETQETRRSGFRL